MTSTAPLYAVYTVPMRGPTLSLVLPIFNEAEILPELARRLQSFFADLGSGVGQSWEVIFVNDGSSDQSLDLLKGLAAAEPRFKILSFARNFGHQMANTWSSSAVRDCGWCARKWFVRTPPAARPSIS